MRCYYRDFQCRLLLRESCFETGVHIYTPLRNHKVKTTSNNLFLCTITFRLLKLTEGSRTFKGNPQSAFNMSENGVKNFKVVVRISLKKMVQEDRFLLQTGRLKTMLTRSFNGIKKQDYLILRTKWMWYMLLFRIISQKKLKYWKIYAHWILHTLSAEQCAGVCIAVNKKNLTRFRKEGNTLFNSIVTSHFWLKHFSI